MQREIGHFHTFSVLEVGSQAVVLDGRQWGRLLLPLDQCPNVPNTQDELEVFVYLDAQENPVPTTLRPAVTLGQVGWLQICDVNNLGAFADWGLPKDLFIPFAEQHRELRRGDKTLVRVYLDKRGRLTGSTHIDHWVADSAPHLKQGDKVSLMIADKTELGYKAVVNHTHWGLLYSNELYRRVRKGQTMDGYIKQIRDDGKIDLSITQPGFSKDKMDTISSKILNALHENDGFLALTDKSPPPQIYATFGVSKKVFKQAVGALYKKRVIALESNGIRLL